MEKLDKLESLDIINQNILKLKELFPQILSDGKIDFDMLQTILGEEIDNNNEKYQFNWNGKTQTIKFAQTPSTGTLLEDRESSKNFDTTGNLYIEGDNVEVLKILQKTYYNKIKMIYIDPPYNTGKDFVYKDNFHDNIKNYKELTGQASVSNAETNGRFHTDWLNMMYSRLMLAKNLLTEDGVIFISIDDNEVNNLKKICDEIFGENNFVTNFIWKKTSNPNSTGNNIGKEHEYVLLYSKSDKYHINLLSLNNDDIEKYKWQDEFYLQKGPYKTVGLNKTGTVTDLRPNLIYDIEAPDGSLIKPSPRWRWSKEKFMNGLAENRIEFSNTNGKWSVSYKQYLLEDNEGNKKERGNLVKTIFDECGRTTDGTHEIKKLFEKVYFDFPKPTALIRKLLYLATSSNDIILDFFSGSATTAHGVMKLNAEDGGNRKFIVVQLPELISEKTEAYNAGYTNLCDIGKERIRRAGEQIKEEQGMLNANLDTGFKVFKLDETNIVPWDASIKYNSNNLFDLNDVIKKGRKKVDIAYEIMLKFGVFDMPLIIESINNKEVYNVGNGYLLLYLDNQISMDEVKQIALLKPKSIVFLDSAFNGDDNLKMNTVKTLETAGVKDIKSI